MPSLRDSGKRAWEVSWVQKEMEKEMWLEIGNQKKNEDMRAGEESSVFVKIL